MTESTDSNPVGSVRIERTYNAPLTRVWEALTNPEQMQVWMCAPSSGRPDEPIEADIRPGGSFRIPMIEDGHRIAAIGEYKEVLLNKRLVLTWSWEGEIQMETKDSRVEIVLEAEGQGTRLLLVHSGFRSQGACDAHSEGWTIALDALTHLLG